MARGNLALILTAVALLAPTATAYGTLDAANDVEPALRSLVMPRRADLYQIYQAPPGDEPRLRIDLNDDGRWVLYLDEGRRNNRQDPEEPSLLAIRFPQLHGNLTDHVLVILPGDVSFAVCTERAVDAATDQSATGLRCGGDMDRDGEGDLNEVLAGQDPLSGSGCLGEATATSSLLVPARDAACGLARPVALSGDGLHELGVQADGGANARVCGRAASRGANVIDGNARDLRCGGDMDGDGTPDTQEVNLLRNPIDRSDDELDPREGL